MSVSAFQQRARYSSGFIIYILGQVGNEALNPKEGLSQFGILSYEMKKRVSGVFWREMKYLDPCNSVRGTFLFNGRGGFHLKAPQELALFWNTNTDHHVFQQTSPGSLYFFLECHFFHWIHFWNSHRLTVNAKGKRDTGICLYVLYVALSQAVSFTNENEVQGTRWPSSLNVAFWHSRRQKNSKEVVHSSALLFLAGVPQQTLLQIPG